MLHAAALTVPREGKAPIDATAPLPADFAALGFAEVLPETEPEAEPKAEPCPPTI